jgi:hypothetical protein
MAAFYKQSWFAPVASAATNFLFPSLGCGLVIGRRLVTVKLPLPELRTLLKEFALVVRLANGCVTGSTMNGLTRKLIRHP